MILWADDFTAQEKKCLDALATNQVTVISVNNKTVIKPDFLAVFIQDVIRTGNQDEFVRIAVSPLGKFFPDELEIFFEDNGVLREEKQRVLEYIFQVFEHFQKQQNWKAKNEAAAWQILFYVIVSKHPEWISPSLYEKIVQGIVDGQLTPIFIAIDEFSQNKTLQIFLQNAQEPEDGDVLTGNTFSRFIVLTIKARLGSKRAQAKLLKAWANMDATQPFANRFFPGLLAFTHQDEAIQLLFNVLDAEDVTAKTEHSLFPDSLHINTVSALQGTIEDFPAQIIIQGLSGEDFSVTIYREWCHGDNRKFYKIRSGPLYFGLVRQSINTPAHCQFIEQ